MPPVDDHPLRYALVNELHARPFPQLSAPSHAVYLAIKDLDVAEVLEKKTYGKSFTEYYVDDADDAIAVDYNAGTDFSFRYVGATQLTIYLYQAGDDLVCVVYEA